MVKITRGLLTSIRALRLAVTLVLAAGACGGSVVVDDSKTNGAAGYGGPDQTTSTGQGPLDDCEFICFGPGSGHCWTTWEPDCLGGCHETLAAMGDCAYTLVEAMKCANQHEECGLASECTAAYDAILFCDQSE